MATRLEGIGFRASGLAQTREFNRVCNQLIEIRLPKHGVPSPILIGKPRFPWNTDNKDGHKIEMMAVYSDGSYGEVTQ